MLIFIGVDVLMTMAEKKSKQNNTFKENVQSGFAMYFQ